MRLDGKVHGTLVQNKDGKEVPEDEFVVFRAHDRLLMPVLRTYYATCVAEGADSSQCQAVLDLVGRVAAWQAAHPDRLKLPDVEPGEIRT